MKYIGDGPYCYANAISMLLSSIGEDISPSQIEVLSGVGLSANTRGGDSFWFDNLGTTPDIGISKALRILGFDCIERSRKEAEPVPLEELSEVLKQGPAVLGPLDMSHLSYLPFDAPLADHFVFAFGINEEEIQLHDPAGYPHVSLPLDYLKSAWKAEWIGYRRGHYRYWTAPRRIHHPTEEGIYDQALGFFRFGYKKTERVAHDENRIIGRDAISSFACQIRGGEVSDDEFSHMVFFLFQLGARRALDFAAFFDGHNAELASLKRKQARQFGQCHTFAVRKSYVDLADMLEQLGTVEEDFRIALCE
ncbi:MAG: hypothetical protein OXH06_05585 [Gemmatimonadetes bacterium]|nr:hypothetical protein [Gemmatimonadota bacterium]